MTRAREHRILIPEMRAQHEIASPNQGQRPLDLPSSTASGPIGPQRQNPAFTGPLRGQAVGVSRARPIYQGPQQNEYPEYLNTLFAKMAALDRQPQVNPQGNVQSPVPPRDILGQLLMESLLR